MRNLFFVLLLAVGCAVANKPASRPQPTPEPSKPVLVLETMQPKPLPHPTVIMPTVIMTPVDVTPQGGMVLKPAVKYQVVGLDEYKAHIPRVEKFFQLLVNDKTILDGKKFHYNTDTSEQIRAKIMAGFEVVVRSWTPHRLDVRWRKTIAYHDDWVIKINTRKMYGRTSCEVINTIAHESTHAWGFGHGDDSSIGKGESFPYWTGDLAEQYCLAGKI